MIYWTTDSGVYGRCPALDPENIESIPIDGQTLRYYRTSDDLSAVSVRVNGYRIACPTAAPDRTVTGGITEETADRMATAMETMAIKETRVSFNRGATIFSVDSGDVTESE